MAPVTPPSPRRSPVRARALSDGASALGVSELLHVTEEARVYVALGHPERAIDVLNDHIRDVPRSMPAAWLMLLDLYHASGRQQDFRRLAEEFHLHCNVQAPPWEDFKPSEPAEGGLDVLLGAAGDLAERLAVDRRDVLEPEALLRVDPVAADEVAVAVEDGDERIRRAG